MARNDSPNNEDNEDQEMERVLREHFDAEAPNLRAPGDPWEWLESRMDEPPAPSFFSRLLPSFPLRRESIRPAFAVAGVAVVAVAVAATVWAITGDGGWNPGDELAQAPGATALPPAPTPATTARQEAAVPTTAAPAATTAPTILPTAPPAATTAPAVPATVAPAATTAPAVPATAPPADAVAIEVTKIVEVETETETPASTAAPAATPSPPMLMVSAEQAAAPSGSGQPPDTTFRDYGRQPFVAASEDNVSTFSLDTDRASYHLALGWARSGYEVDPDSVRAEEWINAFDYQYPPPTDSNEFAISSGLFPHPLDENKLLARIAFQAPELADDRPLNVTLVLDASGSMADGGRVAIARQAAESIRQSLRAQDRIAVVHFTDDVLHQYTVEHRPPDDDRVTDSINRLQPHGSTNVQAGLNLGVTLAGQARSQRPDAYNYVILMSDGVANVDATNPFAILETAYDANAQNPLRLIAVGVGINNYNDVLLEQLAQHGNGWYRYLNDTAQAQTTFSRDNWLALSTPFADQTRAQVTWNPDVVQRWRIIGYENRVTPDHTFTQDRKEFAEIYSGAATTVFYELELVEGWQPGPVFPLERIELRWVDAATGESRSLPNQSPIALPGWPGNADFAGNPLPHLAAIVALAADRYSSLSANAYESDYSKAHRDLSALLEQLRSLSNDLGSLDAYHDFLFLLEHITADVEERMPPATPSGYSR